MASLRSLDEHFWLTRSMARSVGVNLADALADGRLRPDGYSKMVTRCREANCAARCAAWLGAQSSAPVSGPPPFCVHTDQLKALLLN